MCKTDVAGKGNALLGSVIFDDPKTTGVTSDNPCMVTMTLYHNRGCPVFDASRVKEVLEEN